MRAKKKKKQPKREKKQQQHNIKIIINIHETLESVWSPHWSTNYQSV